MNVDYNKLMAMIEARQASNPEAAAALGALVMDINQALAMENTGEGATPDNLVQLWNERHAPALTDCKKLTDKRRKAARARLREFPNRQDWIDFIEAINKNPFLLGENKSGWTANFDWLIKPESIVKFIEGRYNTGGTAPKAAGYRSELDNR
jgi:hypothetical protein